MLSSTGLRDLVGTSAAIRRRQRLQPAGGSGDKIFPPTYPGEDRNSPPQHVFERRRVNGTDTWCVLIDSVQSQANRLEEALLLATNSGRVFIPHLFVDFAEHDLRGLERVTSLDAPHRVYDAILRDSLLDGEPFPQSALGQRLVAAKPEDATAVLEVSPTSLLFGAWHSTGIGGGLGARFARCVVSEIVGIGVPVEESVDRRTGESTVRTAARRTGSRIDPLGVLRTVEVFKGASGWDVTKEGAGKNAKAVRPSEINHGNIAPSVTPLGITCDYVEHTFVLSFAGLRRLRFGTEDRDAAARTLLAALGLLAVAEQDSRGYSLRSRCDLVLDVPAQLEIVGVDGSVEDVTFERAHAEALYREAFEAATAAGFHLATKPIRLTPQPKLVAIVRKSQELALSGQATEAEDLAS
jgi:CRISPR-associated protein Csb1